ncbi:hypothetical protein LPJ70_003585 [Coemansia sp. RSA 2708]|nr:hypothetical protein LPJ70_003585 [Coemansia sp. RSA 2708]
MSTAFGLLPRLPACTRGVQRCYITAANKHLQTERHSSLLPETWILSDSNPNIDIRTAKVADALGLPVAIKHIVAQPKSPLGRSFAGLRSLFGASPAGRLRYVDDASTQRLPRFVIAGSNRALPGLLEVIKQTGGRSMSVFLGLPRTKLAQIGALVLSRLDQMRLRSLGPARANLDNAVSTLLPLSGLSTATAPISTLKPVVAVCIGTGFEAAGFQLLSSDVDRLAEGLLQLPPSHIRIVLDAEPYRGLRSTIESRLIRRLRERSVDTNGVEHPPMEIEVIDYAQAGQPPLTGVLASATHIIATADNIPIVSMAASLQRPVYIAGMERTADLLREYYYVLDTKNLVRRFYPLGSRYSYMVAPEINGTVDELSAIRDHEPWPHYDTQRDLDTVAAFIKDRYVELNS